MITTQQARMARAALELTVKQAASELAVAPNTVLKIEAGGNLNQSTRQAIESGYQRLGIEFLENNGARLKDKT